MIEFFVYIFHNVAEWLPSWIFRRIFPITRCMDRVHVVGGSMGPHIYINESRPSKTLDSYPIQVINTLPFIITVEYVHFSGIFFESKSWISDKQFTLNYVIPSGGSQNILVSHDLTDAQAKTAREYPFQCPQLVFNGFVYFKSPIVNFQKNFSIATRAFVFKENRDPFNPVSNSG